MNVYADQNHVTWRFDFNKVGTNGKRMCKYGFKDEEDCARARDDVAVLYYPQLRLNFPEDPTDSEWEPCEAPTQEERQYSLDPAKGQRLVSMNHKLCSYFPTYLEL